MKRDILFDEQTPLNFKIQEKLPPQGFSVIFILEVLTIAFCCLILPQLSNSCSEANLYLWIFALVIGINSHLLLTGIQNFFQGQENIFKVFHSLFISAGLAWTGFGHYLLAYKGLECFHEDIFWICSTIIGVYDLVTVGLLVSYGLYYCKKVEN